MRRERWKITERLLEQIEGTTGRLVLAVASEPLDVVLYETPVLAKGQAPQNPLRGFVQEAVLVLEQPTAAEISSLLHLPAAVVELVLGNLQQMGGAASDSAGRWSVPAGAPRFLTGGRNPEIWRRTRRLLCYWPKQQVLLPILPRMRLRDLVELEVHKIQGEVADWYCQIASWSSLEGLKRGRAESIRVLPLCAKSVSQTCEKPTIPDDPVPADDILVTKIRMDIIGLTWSVQKSGVWEVISRLWARPTPQDDAEGVPFAPGEPLVGLSLPEHLVGEDKSLDDLGQLFNLKNEAWQKLVNDQEDISRFRRHLEGEFPAIIVTDHSGSGEERRWQGLHTHLSRDARILCYIIPQQVPTPTMRENEGGKLETNRN
jgi:hypothetical protein